MAPPNAIYIVHGEISLLVTAMRRNSRWNTHSHQEEEQDPLVNSFYQLRDVLHTISDLGELELNVYLGPFLEVIRSEDTTGPITGLALSSVNKFLSYGLVDPSCVTAASAIENIADAVTHARFVGTDPGSDEVVLMKILHVLRTLMLSTAGGQLTNESVCEIMQSCFRICFEMRLSELLRKSAEHTLMDMVQLLFSRLPQFKEDLKWMASKKLKMRAGGMDPSRTGRKKKSGKTSKTHKKGAAVALQEESRLSTQTEAQEPMEEVDPTQVPDAPEVIPRDPTPPDVIPQTPGDHMNATTIATTPVAPGRTMVDIHDSFRQGDTDDLDQSSTAAPDTSTQCDTSTHPVDTSTQDVDTSTQPVDASIQKDKIEEDNDAADATSRLAVPDIHDTKKILNDSDCPISEHEDDGSVHSATEQSDAASVQDSEYVNPRGIRFTAHQQHAKEGVAGPLVPYGLPCVRELFRFLISLTNPLDRHNTDVMIHMGLSLLAAALESGADNITTYNSLLVLVKDEMTKNLFSLLQSERLSLFAASLRVCFLLFESMRSQLKLQMEMYLNKLMEIIASESIRISYEQRELTLEAMVQLFKIPGLVTEIYLNYDCDLYCSFLFEDLTKLLSKNAFPVSGLFSTHLLCLDALLTVVDSIEQHCHSRILNTPSGHDPQKPVGAIDDSSDDVTIEQPAIAVSGFIASQHHKAVAVDEDVDKTKTDEKKTPFIRPNRMKISQKIPTEEELLAIKHKKKLIQSGADQFNVKPSKGIQFLQDHGLFSTPLQPNEIVQFLKENPTLDKKQIGEYLSRKNNVDVLKAFVKSFHFEDLRVDESLRQYLETFRLPGEAPVISYLIEHFAEHWHQSNPGTHIVDPDAAFTLTYAIIMLNVDQHNHNVKKQSVPMTVKEFKTNVRKVNGGNDFDQDMLEEIYTHIKNDEIVMPAEQTGLVRDNYQWKVLLKRGATKEGIFLHVPTGAFDHDLFHLIWGPTVAALSFVFDKSLDDTIIQKAISGFRKCAMISAHYGLSDVFDNLVISLCKFTTLLSTPESPEHLPITFGTNLKAQLAAKTVFALAHRHGDILREGWKNILECMLQLYKAKLLPKLLVEVEDFLAGRLSLVKEDSSASQRADSGVLSSFYSYFTTDTPSSRGPSPEDQELIKQAHNCIRECHLEQLITDCKFLRIDSLQELIKALIFAGQGGDNTDGIDEDSAVFFLELLIRVVLQNRDRCAPIWQSIRDHVYNLIVTPSEHTMLVERAVVGLLRLAIRLLRREEIAPQVLTSIRILLMMKPKVIHGVSRQIAFGLHELLRTNAANIHSAQDWFTLFSLLEICGAGSNPPAMMSVGGSVNPEGVVPEAVTPVVQRTPEHTDNGEGAQSDSELTVTSQSSGGDRGYTSDSELYEGKQHRGSTELELRPMLRDGSWLLVNKSDLEANNKQREQQQQQQQQQTSGNNSNLFSIDITTDEIKNHDPKSLMKASETLAFLVRDAVHVTPHNFESCVHTIRTFVEASINGGHQKHPKKHSHHEKGKHKHGKRKSTKMKKSKSSPSNIQMDSDEEDEGEGIVASYHSLSIQLLDLMHTLHTRAAQIYRDWAEEEKNQEQQDEVIDAGTSALWVKCWCPLLQCIARLCCDTRRQVRSQALTYLQRALLVHDLQTLSAVEWEACFNKVLFPLLHKLLGTINPQDPNGIEETRMRASTLLCKVFLQHLSPLLSLSTFTALWLTILDFMDKYMHADRSDLLCEAIPESLKNMLLVMHTAGILEGEESQLWKLTWDRIDSFLPQLREEVFRPHQAPDTRKMQPGTVEDPSSLESPDTPAQTTQPSGSTQALPPPVVKPVVNTQVVSPARPESPDTVIEIGMPDDSDSSRPESPLNQEVTAPQQQYILHPPLPDTPSKLPSVHGVDAPTVPILLNPDIIQGGPMPIISPQGSADELTSEPTSQ